MTQFSDISAAKLNDPADISVSAIYIFRKLVSNSYPVVMTNIFSLILSFVELYFASFLGDPTLSGVTVAVTWSTLGFSLSLAVFSTGVTREIAVRHSQGANFLIYAKSVFLVSIGTGAIGCLIFFFLANVVISWMGMEGESLNKGILFLQVFGLALPGLFWLGGFQGLMRGVGKPNVPNVIISSAMGVSVLLMAFFSFSTFGLGLGVLGLALGIVLAFSGAALVAGIFLIIQYREFSFISKSKLFDSNIVAGVFRTSLPLASVWFIVAFTIASVLSLMAQFGESVVVAVGIVLRLETLFGVVASAFGSGLLYVAAEFYDQKNWTAFVKAVRIQQVLVCLIILPAIVFLVLYPSQWVGLFSDLPEIIATGNMNTRIFVLGLPFMAMLQLIGFTLVALGVPLFSVSLIVVKNLVVTLPILWCLVKIFEVTNLELIFIGQVIGIPVVWIYGEVLLKRRLRYQKNLVTLR